MLTSSRNAWSSGRCSHGVGIIRRVGGGLTVWFVSVIPPDGEMIMETDTVRRVQPDGAAGGVRHVAGLGAGPVAGVGAVLFQAGEERPGLRSAGLGAVSGLDAGKVTAFMVDWTRRAGTRWTAKAMVTSLRAFLRFAHATGRTARPAGGSGSRGRVVADVRRCPRGMKAAEIARLLAGCDRDTAVACGTTRSCRCWPGWACEEPRPPGCSSATSTGGPVRSRSRARAASTERLRCGPGRGSAGRLADDGGRECESRTVFVTVRRPTGR